MSDVKNGNIILTNDEANSLIKNLFHPDEQTLVRRMNFLQEIDDMSVSIENDGTVLLDVPNFLLREVLYEMDEEDNQTIIYSEFCNSLELKVNQLNTDYLDNSIYLDKNDNKDSSVSLNKTEEFNNASLNSYNSAA